MTLQKCPSLPPAPAGASMGPVGLILLTMLWPAAAAVSLSISVGSRDVTAVGLMLVACGTMAAYGLDRLIDGRHRDSPRLRRMLFTAVVAAAMATGALACTAWWRAGVCAVLGLTAAAYVPLKRSIPKNLLTTVAWTVAIATLPFEFRPVFAPDHTAAVIAVAFIMAANTILCDLPDIAADRVAGVRGLVPAFGVRAGASAAVTSGCLGAVAAGVAGSWGLQATALALAFLAIALARNPSRSRYRRLADAVVTVVPGPVALIFR